MHSVLKHPRFAAELRAERMPRTNVTMGFSDVGERESRSIGRHGQPKALPGFRMSANGGRYEPIAMFRKRCRSVSRRPLDGRYEPIVMFRKRSALRHVIFSKSAAGSSRLSRNANSFCGLHMGKSDPNITRSAP